MSLRSTDALRQHVAECDECTASPPPVDRIAALLAADRGAPDAAALSRQVRLTAQPLLQAIALRQYRRQVAAAIAVALAPLPLILAYDAYLLRLLHAAVSALLGGPLATYVVVSYAACLLFLFALSYAAIPILMARNALPRLSPNG
jgi:hypothetical protein